MFLIDLLGYQYVVPTRQKNEHSPRLNSYGIFRDSRSNILLFDEGIPMRRVIIFDTTLRDGDQAAGFAFDRKTKPVLAVALAKAGVDIIEAGFPLSSQADFKACCDIVSVLKDFPVQAAVICRGKINDIRKTAAVLDETGILHVTLPVSDAHLAAFLNISRTQLIERAVKMVSFASGLVSSVEIGAEDATRSDPDFLCEYCHAVIDAGASVVNIADTTGLFTPPQIISLVTLLRRQVSGFSSGQARLSIHCHNDAGLAVANTLAAIEAGCDQIEATVGGLGERSGNAALEEVAANLFVHPEIYNVSTGLHAEYLGGLADYFYCVTGISPGPMKPLTGWNVCAHASGLHQKGLVHSANNYLPETARICNAVPERIVLSRHSGKAGVHLIAEQLGLTQPDNTVTEQLLNHIKESGLRTFGVTEFLKLAFEYDLLPVDFPQPISCNRFSEYRTDEHCRVTGIVSTAVDKEQTITGEGLTVESAVLDAVKNMSGLSIQLTKTELIGKEGQFHLYAEMLVDNRTVITAVRFGFHPSRLLFECCLDAVNQVQRKSK
jgi:2-isopropylmalate synthase